MRSSVQRYTCIVCIQTIHAPSLQNTVTSAFETYNDRQWMTSYTYNKRLQQNMHIHYKLQRRVAKNYTIFVAPELDKHIRAGRTSVMAYVWLSADTNQHYTDIRCIKNTNNSLGTSHVSTCHYKHCLWTMNFGIKYTETHCQLCRKACFHLDKCRHLHTSGT